MVDCDRTPQCLSAEHHGPDVIRNFLVHYFGCIEIHERPSFLSREINKSFWDKEIEIEMRLLEHQGRSNGTEFDDLCSQAEANVDEKICSLATSIEAQYRRIDTLRKALAGVECDHPSDYDKKQLARSGRKHLEGCNLVECVTASCAQWRADDETKRGIDMIRSWKRANNRPTDDLIQDARPMDPGRYAVREVIKKFHADSESILKEEEAEYDLEQDISCYITQWEILGRERQTIHGRDLDRQSTSSSHAQDCCSPKQSISAVSKVTTENKNEDIQSPGEFDRAERVRCPNSEVTTKYDPSHASKCLWSGERFLRPTEETTSDHRFEGHFPDQKISLRFLLGGNSAELENDNVVLDKDRHSDRVRYIHIPHNNMAWIERAIARYFNDHTPNHECTYRNSPIKTRSHMILRPEYWRDRQQGGRRSAVQARHMRATCEQVSSNIWDSEDKPGNLVFFMPYLHWEENRKREEIAKITDQEVGKYGIQRYRKAADAKNERIENRCFEGNPLKTTRQPPTHLKDGFEYMVKSGKEWGRMQESAASSRTQRTATELAEEFASSGPVVDEHDTEGTRIWQLARLKTDRHGRPMARSKLGQFLLSAARLFEAMALYRDQQLLVTYLHHDPPLHPRRTLDQSYYWTLKTGKAFDRDQVVYRGTTMDERSTHHYRQQEVTTKCERCLKDRTILHRILNHSPQKSPSNCWHGFQNPENFAWDDHWEETQSSGCESCRDEIRKVPRVIMVDQLWMWILDKRTIITSFPQKYGSDEQGSSDVHEAIRGRIKNARRNSIRSVFDVALIVIDECSNNLFGVAKASDRQPQVIEILGEAIDKLTNMQTVTFQHLRYWSRRAFQFYLTQSGYTDASHVQLQLLSINDEAGLQWEIKDIIDELNIMININTKQGELIKRFTKHVENMFDPSSNLADKTPDCCGATHRGQRRSVSSSRRVKDDSRTEKEENEWAEANEKEELSWFRKHAYELISKFGDRGQELQELRNMFVTTNFLQIKDIIDHKQQQAGNFQAWQSVKQADESVQQGRVVMIFTIVTIVFLPLSFMSSVFGMNNSSIGDTKMSFRDQANYMFPISAAVILVSTALAFWKFPRTLLWSSYKMIETWLLVNSGAYYCWLVIQDKYKLLTSDDLSKILEKEVIAMKAEVEKRRGRQIVKQYRKQKAEFNAMCEDWEREIWERERQADDNELAATAELHDRQDQGVQHRTGVPATVGSWTQSSRRPRLSDENV